MVAMRPGSGDESDAHTSGCGGDSSARRASKWTIENCCFPLSSSKRRYSVSSGSRRQVPNHKIYVMGTGNMTWKTVYRRAYASELCLVSMLCPQATITGSGHTREMSTTRTGMAISSRRRVLVVLTLLAAFLLQVAYSSLAAVGLRIPFPDTWPTVPAAFGMIVALGFSLLRSRFSLRAIVFSSALGAIVFVLIYAGFSEVADPGAPDLASAFLTRVFYSIMVSADIVVAFVICMIAGALIRYLHLDPARKNQRYR